MPIIKNILRKARNKPQGLDKIDVLIHEEGLTSQYFNVFDFPDNLPKGSSSFLIDGSDLLKDEVELKVEIIDSSGNVVFTTPIPNYLEGTSRRISIEIYDDVAPGPAFLYIVGELDPTRTNVPQSFRDVYNIRYKRPIYINTSIVNTEPIIFYGQPTINVNEIVKGHIDDVRATAITTTSTITGSVSLEVESGFTPVTIPTETADDFFSDIEDRTSVGFENEIFSKRPKNKKDAVRGKGLGKGGGKGKSTKSNTAWSLNVVEMEKGADNDLDKITSDLVGAEITFTRPDLLIDSEKFPSNQYTIPTTFSTKISEVINNTTFKTKDAFEVTKNNGQKEFASIPASSSGVTIKYETFSEETTSETFFRSFADITVGNLRTFSGDVYKAKVFTKDNGTLGDFEEIYDNVVESQQVLVDTLSPTGFRDIGFFHTQSIIDNQWTTGSITTVVTQDDEFLIDGALISGSNGALGVSDVFTTSQSFSLQNNVPYTLEFNTFFFKADKKDVDGNISQQAKMNVYLTGSAITGTEEDDFYLGEVDIPLNSNNQGKIENVFNTFNSSKTGAPETQVKFEVESGRFVIQDVKLRPYSQTNFNPDFFRALTPMPRPTRRGDNFDFLVKFYDANNNEAEVFAVTESIAFEGPPLVIDGTDNVLTGSVFLGNVSGSGIELHGGSAYIRSIGYNGFDNTISNNLGGFMLFSGSVKDQVDSSETYEGVGLEIVDAHGDEDRFFKFKTNAEGTPSEFEIQTDTFFFGRSGQFISGSNNNIVISSSNFFLGDDNGAFISGSNGNLNISSSTFFLGGGSTFVSGSNDKLEISSSNFHLDDDGSVTLQGQITATLGGIIGGFSIGSASLFTGAEATPNFFISGSATGTGFEKANLFISSSGFQVSGDGEMSASAGHIGGFNIVRDGLGSANDAFQVTGSTGQITGSNVLFSGGKIAAFSFNDKRLSSFTTSTQDKFGISLDADYQLITIHGDSGDGKNNIGDNDRDNVMVAIGQLTDDQFGIKGFTTAGNRAFELSTTRLEIGGFTFDNEKIQGGNLILDKEGTIKSADFSSGNIAGSGQGFRLTALDNGFLEVENARIRGTLSTAVFEKETVNAVGGQLLVGNSTVITGSGGFSGVTASAATMSVENVSGFTGSYNGFNTSGDVSDIDSVDGEILILKKVDNTGFSTEYVCVQSASFNDPSNTDTNPSGLLYVTRSFGLGTGTLGTGPGSNFTGSVGEGAKNYEDGQVIVSTGKYISGTGADTVGTGFINLNARPTDPATPYIDIIERTGSKVYEMELKARLGDLSGLSSGLVGSDPGFGLFSENVFLTGKITATSGKIAEWDIDGNKLSSLNASKKGIILDADPSSPTITISGSSSGTDINRIELFHTTDTNFGIKGTIDGDVRFSLGSSNQIGGFGITATEISSSNENLILKNNGQITASAAKISGDITITDGDLAGVDAASISGSFGSRLIITSNDVTIAHNSGENKGIFNAAGLTVVGNNQTGSVFGNFGAEIYGASNKNERVSITSQGVTQIANNITGSLVHAGGMEIYGASDKNEKIIVDSSGISILANNVTGSSFTNTTASIFGSSDKEERVEVVGDGLMVYDTNKAVAKFGATTEIGKLEDDFPTKLQIDSTGKLSVLSGSDKIFEVGTIDVTEPVIGGDGRLAEGAAATKAVFNAPSMSSQFIEAFNFKPKSKFLMSISNLSSTNGSQFGFTESGSAEGNGNHTGNFKVNHYSVKEAGSIPNPVTDGRTADLEPAFQFNYTHASNHGNSVSMSRFSGGVLDLNVLIEPKSGSTLKPADKEFTALMINVDDNTEAAPSGDGYSFIHCKGSLTGSTALDKFQVSSSGDVIASGNITAFGTAFSSVSDRNWKKDIQTFSGSLDKLLELKPRKFKWKKDNKEDYGFIAQEVEEILPHIVRDQGFNKAGKGTGSEKHKTIDYSKLTPYLVDTIQELTKRIEKLEKKVK
tara:strand:+ start:98 stop:5956 length:5859 start_codon:yes stop_codon:yes gene_type:complete